MSNLLKQVAEPQNQDTTFIYGLVDPRSGYVRYVGKSNNPKRRRHLHLNPSSLRPKTRKNRWIIGLLNAGKRPELILLEQVSDSSWEEAEIRWIAYYRSIPQYPQLTNGTSGGDGAQKGHKKSPETLKKLSVSNLGRVVSQETREKISIANRGRKRTPEQREHIRIATLKARIRDFGHKEKSIVPKIPRICSSIFRGVSRNNRDSRWKAYVTVDGQYISLGVFDYEIDAARSHDLWVIQNRSYTAYTNFPRNEYEDSTYSKPPRKEIQKNNTSGYRGVTWFKKNKTWQASAAANGKNVHIGYFKDKVEGAHAYDRWVIQHRSATAYTNFPRDHYPDLLPPTS